VPRLKRLSGKEVLSILGRFGFMISSVRGSHIKLQRIYLGNKQSLTIPNHPELDPGTCRAIFRQACRYINPDELRPWFYSP
jgi:predicted RNA binding protein YcfA (HicA-like mRNA interferase family)